jgi:hypothetical protein
MLMISDELTHVDEKAVRVGYIEQARRHALMLLDRFGVETIEHLLVEGFASRRGIGLVETQIDGAKSELIVGPNGATIVLPPGLTDRAERRWLVAHELGHFELNHPARPAGKLHLPSPRTRRRDRRHWEDEADAFASALLMPEPIVDALCSARPMTLDVVWQLATQCDVPWIASALRLMRATWRVCAIVLSHHGEIRWVFPSLPFLMLFAGHIYPGDPLAAGSLARRFFDTGEPCGPATLVPASSWLEGASTELQLQEHSIACPNNDAVMTMLWHAGESDARPPQMNAETMSICHDHFLGELEANPSLAQIAA